MPSNFLLAGSGRHGGNRSLAVWLAWLMAALGGLSRPASAEDLAGPPALLDEMDGAKPVLQLLNPGPQIRLVGQTIERGRLDNGGSAEHLSAAIPPGESGQIGYALPAAPVIEELNLAAWIWCNRPGAQLAALVVLPRSLDPETKAPWRLLIRSNAPAAGDGWRQITLGNLPAGLAAAARVARAQRRAPLDERGAYVSHLVILAPGGPGIAELWVDQISMHGALRAAPAAGSSVQLAAASENPSPSRAEINPAQAGPAASAPRPIPPVPRIIQWQGEPFELLSQLGFDALAMGRAPTDADLAEARRLGLFLVCTPPSVEAIEAHGIGAEYDPVMAWDLGELAAAGDAGDAERWAAAIRRRDPRQSRPLLLRPSGAPLAASRVADVLLLGRPTLNSTQSWPDYAAWLTQQRRLSRPGTGTWIAVDTHCSGRAMAQWAALGGGRPAIVPATFHELSLATTAAFATLPRGFYFQSQASLAGANAESHRRALALELTNLRLGLVEPWLASGKPATPARSSRPDLTAMVLTVERSRLIVPVHWSTTRAPTPAAAEPLSFILPGVPESCDAYLLTVAGPRRLETRRVTGGLRVLVDQLPADSFVLLTEDGYAFSQVQRYLRHFAARAAQVRLELAVVARQQAAVAVAALPPAVLQATYATEALARADANLTGVNRTLQTEDCAAAYARAAAADEALADFHQRLQEAIWPAERLGAPPLPAGWSTLPDLVRLAAAVDRAGEPLQSLPGGEFNSVEALVAAGWQRQEGAAAGVETAVRLSSQAPAEGASCLELEVRQTDAGDSPVALAAAPAWITSPSVEIPAPCLLEVTGMARVEETPIGSADPLMIFDAIGGEESAVRIASAPTWTPFRMIRVAPPGSSCRVTIALGGVGSAQVDSLRYRFIGVKAPPAEAARGQVGPLSR